MSLISILFSLFSLSLSAWRFLYICIIYIFSALFVFFFVIWLTYSAAFCCGFLRLTGDTPDINDGRRLALYTRRSSMQTILKSNRFDGNNTHKSHSDHVLCIRDETKHRLRCGCDKLILFHSRRVDPHLPNAIYFLFWHLVDHRRSSTARWDQRRKRSMAPPWNFPLPCA